MKIKMSEENKRYYYPCCIEKNCNGILGIKINNENFSINCICDKNKLHIKNNIYFKTFERFYLKEIKIIKCNKCNMCLENDLKYECKKCEKIYCGFCYIYDEHIKNNIEHLLIINNKCKYHKKDLTLYCKKCNEHLCIFCAEKSKDKLHYNHPIDNLYNIIPSENEINEIKNIIKEDKILYEEYISLLDEWMIKLNNKINIYKQNLRNKISLLEKLYYNFYKYFNHYVYYKNFNENILYDNNRSSMKSFIKYNNFDNFKDILIQIMKNKEKDNEIQYPDNNEITLPFIANIKKIKRINDNHFFVHSYDSVKLYRLNENNKLSFLENTKIEFNNDIYSITSSIKKDKIYVCLSNSEKIKIFNCDLINGFMESNIKEISYLDNSDGNFKKCIELSNDILAAIEQDKQIISIWDINNYTYKNKITINGHINDILLINDEYFVTSQPNNETIIFHNINKLNNEIIIRNINSKENGECLTSNNNYLLVYNDKGISIISIKYKEFIQYYQTTIEYQSSYNINLKIDNNNFIYYLFYNDSTFRESNKVILDIYKLKNDEPRKIARYRQNLEHENDDRDLSIYINQKNELSFTAEGRIFICDKIEIEDNFY